MPLMISHVQQELRKNDYYCLLERRNEIQIYRSVF